MADHEATFAEDGRIQNLVAVVRSGGALHPRTDYENRLSLAVVRYVNGMGAGDVPDEYARVLEAMASG